MAASTLYDPDDPNTDHHNSNKKAYKSSRNTADSHFFGGAARLTPVAQADELKHKQHQHACDNASEGRPQETEYECCDG